MRRGVWCVSAGLTMGCGLVALMWWSVPATVGWLLAGGLIVVSWQVCRAPDEDPISWSAVLRTSLPWPTMTLAVGGLFTVLEPVSALLVSMAGLAAAWEAGLLDGSARDERRGRRPRRFGRRARAEADAGATILSRPLEVDPAEAVLAVTDELTDADLCMAWRSSYVALDRAVDTSDRLRAVEIRELILDEFGRRDAAGLEAWFRSGARAAGGPDRYLRHLPDRATG